MKKLIYLLIFLFLIYFVSKQFQCYHPELRSAGFEGSSWMCLVGERPPLPEKPKKAVEKTEEQIEQDALAEDAIRAGSFYSDMLCMLVDPQFWENLNMNDGVGNGSSRDAKNLTLTRVHQYRNYTVAKRQIRKHWGSDAFKKAVKQRANVTACGRLMAQKKISLDKILNKKEPGL